MATNLMLIGGFLGAGKTTLISRLAQKLKTEGKKTGLITNDQAPSLVDTVFLAKDNDLVEEVSGSCFCCNYIGFIKSVEKLAADGVNFILAEPVGSCADLSATILQPVKDLEKDKVRLLGFAALVDPERLETLLEGKDELLHPSAIYIMGKQLEEADIVVITKIDKFQKDFIETLIERTKKAFPRKPVVAVSSYTGAGIDELLKIAENIANPGSRVVDMDYDTYAEGEAVLGWLNMETTLSKKGEDWKKFVGSLLNAIAAECEKKSIPPTHIKLFIEGGTGAIIGNLTGKKDTVTINGETPHTDSVTLTLNARAQTSPENLQTMIENVLAGQLKADNVTSETRYLNCLMPGRPNPTHRYDKVINN